MLENRLVSKGKRGSKQAVLFEEKRSHRQQVRQWLQTTPVEGFEDEPTFPGRERKRNYDGTWHTGPLFRWLDSQTGNHWQGVLSALHQQLSARTDARRIILDLAEPCIKPDAPGWSWEYYVDDDGIFCKRQRGRSMFLNGHERDRILGEVNRWLDSRLIRQQGNKLYWAKRTEYHGPPLGWISYRQDRELNEAEYHYFEELPLNIQKDVLARFEHQLTARRQAA